MTQAALRFMLKDELELDLETLMDAAPDAELDFDPDKKVVPRRFTTDEAR